MSGIVFYSLYFNESMFVRNECIIHDLLLSKKHIKPYLFNASMQFIHIHMVVISALKLCCRPRKESKFGIITQFCFIYIQTKNCEEDLFDFVLAD